MADSLSDALRVLSRFVVADLSLGDTLLRVSEITSDAIPGADFVGITMLGDDGRPTTAICTDETAPEVDAAQYEAGSGPCLDAWRTRQTVRIDDTAEGAADYPEFAQAAADHGVLSTLSLPLVVADHGVGAMNLYARATHAFSEEDESLGEELASAAAVALANSAAYWRAHELSENLTQAMRSRAVIEQAKGMLMARSPDLDPDEAFELLRKASQREHIKLRDVALRMVERRVPLGTDGP